MFFILFSIPIYLLAFLIPGSLALYPLKLPKFETIVLGSTLGIVLWAIQGYILGVLGIRWASYIYIIFAAVLWIKVYSSQFRKAKLQNILQKVDPRGRDYLSFLIVAIGTLVNLSAVWFIGTKDSSGLFFCCRGVPDAIFHLSLTNELIKNFPPYEPGMVGIYLKNYHFLSNLVTADLARVFKIDFIYAQFRFMSVVLALLLGLQTFVLAKILNLGKNFARWLAIFLYASGDILYLLLLLRGSGLNFGVTIVDDATKLLAGPPRAFSILIFFCAVCLFVIWVKKKNLYCGILLSIVVGSLVGFKIYTAILALIGLGSVGIYYLLKRNLKMLLPILAAAVIAFAYYFPINKDAGGIHFNGMWRFENFMLHEKLEISRFEYLRLIKAAEGKHLEVIALEISFVIFYFVFLFGTANLGFAQSKNSLKLLPRELNIFLISGVLTSIILGSLFLQKTGGANTVQFLISAFIAMSIYAALSISYWTKKINIRYFKAVLIIVFLLTVARAGHEILENFININSKNGFYISNAQLKPLDYLKNESPANSIFVVDPWMAEDEPLMYTTFLTNRRVFLAGAGVLRDHGQDVSQREEIVRQIYGSADQYMVKKLLNENAISYIYVSPGITIASDKNADFLQKVFEEQEFKIYRVN